jgi:membrane associated rhomboid family serine protease
MNTVMLIAFGSGVEKWIGPKKFLTVFIGSALLGCALHFAVNFYSPYPVIGASGGISGLFAVALLMLNRVNGTTFGNKKYGMLPVIALWVAISLLFGLLGSPDGAAISWESHIGGFLGGFLIAKIMKL